MTGYFVTGAILALIAAFCAFMISAKSDTRRNDLGEDIASAGITGVVIFFLWPLAAPIGLAIVAGIWYSRRTRVN